jgi:glutaredoxin 3
MLSRILLMVTGCIVAIPLYAGEQSMKPLYQPGDVAMTQPKVVVYTASYCPYCVNAKRLLEQKNVTFQEIDVTDPTTRGDMITRAGGRKTVPQIFIGDTHVGGFNDLSALERAGKLDILLGR